jgi:uncharacterized protein YndB with AHSA1/START domain
MTDSTSTAPVIKEIHLDASPEIAFGYFTDPTKMTQWLCTEATTDPRPGGINHQTHPGEPGDPNGPYQMHGEFQEVDFPNRIVFSWGYTNSEVGVEPGTTRVEVDLTAANGGTDLRLTHSGITANLPSENYDQGWTQMLENLAKLDMS